MKVRQTTVIDEVKRCPRCDTEKDRDKDFYKRKLPSGNIAASGWCKECAKAFRKAHYRRSTAPLQIEQAEGRD